MKPLILKTWQPHGMTMFWTNHNIYLYYPQTIFGDKKRTI